MIVLQFDSYDKRHALGLIGAYAKAFEERLLASFENIEAEADAAAAAFYERAMSQPSWEGEGPDGSEIADAAIGHGMEVYGDLEFVRQQLIGLATAGLYHLWERLLKEFIVREFRYYSPPPIRPDQVRRVDFAKLEQLLRELGWAIRGEEFYDDLDCLRLVANTVKHGDGPSCDDLAQKAPGLFRDYGHDWLNSKRRADDLELKKEDFVRFAAAARTFFERFPARLEAS